MFLDFANSLRRNGWRLLVRFVNCLFIAPILLLHLLVFLFSFHDQPLPDTERIIVSQPDGQPLFAYRHSVQHPRITIIFVHGTPASGSVFREQMAYPFPAAELITYDRPGFGASPGSSAQANLGYQSTTLVELIRYIRTEKVILVGHSYGGPIVLQVAAMGLPQVIGVAMIGGSVSPQEEHPWPIQYFGATPLISALLPGPARSSNEELLQLKADLISLQEKLLQVRCPVLMLQGTADEQVPATNVPYLETRFAELGKSNLLQTHLYPGYNHFMMWEHPAETNAALEAFFQRCLSPF